MAIMKMFISHLISNYDGWRKAAISRFLHSFLFFFSFFSALFPSRGGGNDGPLRANSSFLATVHGGVGGSGTVWMGSMEREQE